MAIKLTELAVKLEAHGADGVKKAMDDIGRSGKTLGKNLTDIINPANALKGAFAGIAGGLAVGAIGSFFKGAVEEAGKAQQAMMLLETATANAGGNFAKLQPQFEAAADGIEKFTRFGDDEAIGALTKMVAVTGDTAGSLKNLGLAADLATFKGIELEQAAELIGRAMNGNLGPLKKMGVDLKDGGDAMDQLSKKIGGFAEKDAKTLPGQLNQISNAWGDVKKAIGNAILGMDGASSGGEIVVRALRKLEAWVTSNASAIAGFVKWVFKLGRQFIDLGADMWKMVETARVAFVKLNGFFLTFDQTVKRTFGRVVSGLGDLLATITTPLRALGITIADGLVSKLQNAGKSMQEDALRMTAQIAEDTKKKVDAIVGVAKVAKAAINDVANTGGHSTPPTRSGAGTGKGSSARPGHTGTEPTISNTPSARPGGPMPLVPESFIKPTDTGIAGVMRKQDEAIAEAVDEFAKTTEASIATTLGDAIYNGFSEAFSGEGISGLFKGLLSSALSGLGSIFVEMGRKMIAASALMAAFKNAIFGFLPPAGFIAGAALIALGAGMGALANRGGGGGASSLASSSMTSSSRVGEDITRFKFIDRQGFMAPVKPQPSVTLNATIIGVNDPTACRLLSEMVEKHSRRRA